jgi:hypothetical protein
LTPAVQHDEQVSTTTPATLEQANIPDKQEPASSEISVSCFLKKVTF